MTNPPNWIELTHEESLEPELPIIDPHHHLWERPGNRYVLDELLADVAGQNVRQTVFVECSSMYRAAGPEPFKPIGETEWVQGIAAQSASGGFGATRVAAGIVGSADLRLGDAVVPVLEAHLAAAPNRFRGIRHRAAWAAPGTLPNQPAAAGTPEHLLLDADFRRGFAWLRVYALSFEAWAYHPQLPEVADLARAFPNTVIILNHLGAPLVGGGHGTRDEVFAQWRRDLAAVAACENVVLKVGGIQMVVNGFGWHERERPPTSDELLAVNRDWYLAAIELFGPERCMFESNFPVDRLSCSYTVLWNQFKKLSAGFTPAQRGALLHDTARRVYRLP